MPSPELQVTAADQNDNDYRLASAVAPHVILRNIYLRAVSAEMNDSRAETAKAIATQELPASVSWKSSHEYVEEDLSLNVRLDFNVAIGQKPNIKMACSYLLEYGLDSPPPAESRDALLTAFAKVNGVYNAWPYLRENLQTMCARMSVPPPVLPVYRVMRPQPKAPKPAESGQQAT